MCQELVLKNCLLYTKLINEALEYYDKQISRLTAIVADAANLIASVYLNQTLTDNRLIDLVT